MKNSMKIGALALVLVSSLVACDPPSKGDANSKTPVDSPQNKIDTSKKTGIDSAKNDTAKKP